MAKHAWCLRETSCPIFTTLSGAFADSTLFTTTVFSVCAIQPSSNSVEKNNLRKLCETWQWSQASVVIHDCVCRNRTCFCVPALCIDVLSCRIFHPRRKMKNRNFRNHCASSAFRKQTSLPVGPSAPKAVFLPEVRTLLTSGFVVLGAKAAL